MYFFYITQDFHSTEINGRENLIGVKGPIIIASNHASEMDVTVLHMIFPIFFRTFSDLLCNNPVEKFITFGWRSYIYGNIFFNMLGGTAFIRALETIAYHLKTICFFWKKAEQYYFS